MIHDPHCTRCGAPLKVQVVQIPVYAVGYSPVTQQNEQTMTGHTEREEVSDCARCTGAY